MQTKTLIIIIIIIIIIILYSNTYMNINTIHNWKGGPQGYPYKRFLNGTLKILNNYKKRA